VVQYRPRLVADDIYLAVLAVHQAGQRLRRRRFGCQPSGTDANLIPPGRCRRLHVIEHACPGQPHEPDSRLDVLAHPELMVRTGGFLPFFDFFDLFGLRPRDTGDM
jgi:hypothetical protein